MTYTPTIVLFWILFLTHHQQLLKTCIILSYAAAAYRVLLQYTIITRTPALSL